MRSFLWIGVAALLVVGLVLATGLSGVERRAGAEPPNAAGTGGSPTRCLTAETDASRIETFRVTSDEKPAMVPCYLSGRVGASYCLGSLRGPFVVTDISYPGDEFTMFVAGDTKELRTTEEYEPRWGVKVGGQRQSHGVRYLVKPGERLFFSDPPVSSFRWIVVSGYRPY
jgi:hypothetical protein